MIKTKRKEYETEEEEFAFNDGFYAGITEIINKQEEKQEKKILMFIDKLIEEQDGERVNNNIWRKSAEELNEDFIKTLKKLREFIKEWK